MYRLLALILFLSLIGCAWSVSPVDRADRRTPLERAALEGDATEFKRLLTSGSDPNDKRGLFGCPLNSAAQRKGNVEVIRMLLAAGANPNGRGETDKRCWASPLLHAASAGDVANTRALLEAGASVTASPCSKLVAGWLKPPIAELLVKHGLNLNDVDEQGRNQLHIALAPPVVPSPEGIEYLVRSGVALNARDSSGKTPLSYWREPRYYEGRSFSMWLIERISGDPIAPTERQNYAKISAFLDHSGALP